ncbi:MAG: pantetheine-phosphate adenylyltransferase [Erysipelotrichaceae bacterium]|nr:pantetheine-phosphate adenylyltransferase [Erysipelotrichaceae bacterium]
MKIAVYPGSFDPVTSGHLDIIERASHLVDKVYVVIMQNPNKRNIFSVEERLAMLETVTKEFTNVECTADVGLTVVVAKKLGAKFLIRGIRATMDFEQELQLATANMTLAGDIETIFFITKPENSFISSSTVREIAMNHGDFSRFVPEEIVDTIKKKYEEN